jgi:DNA-binding NarL/FixJ family response regulator
MALTERERQILRLKADGVSDYRIARKLKMETSNVAVKTLQRKIKQAKANLEFIDKLK